MARRIPTVRDGGPATGLAWTRLALATGVLLMALQPGVALADSPNSQSLNNAGVVALVAAGLDEEVVVAKIQASTVQFDTSTAALVALQKQEVPSAVLVAMIEASAAQSVTTTLFGTGDSPDPAVPHPSGVYLLDSAQAPGRMTAIDATTSNQARTGGRFGYMVTGGLITMKIKTVVPQLHARTAAANGHPVFYFYFDLASRSLSNVDSGETSALWATGAVVSPSEFSLVRFDARDGHREVKVGRVSLFQARAGVMDEDRIPFHYDLVRPGVYKVAPDAELTAGEYGFVYSAAMGGGGTGLAGAGAMTAKVFDFSVGPTEVMTLVK